MDCPMCLGTGRVVRIIGTSNAGSVTCPLCIRGITVLGTHEMLRDARGKVHKPGERIDGPTGMILSGLIRTEPKDA